MYAIIADEFPKVAEQQGVALVGQPDYVQNPGWSITATSQCS